METKHYTDLGIETRRLADGSCVFDVVDTHTHELVYPAADYADAKDFILRATGRGISLITTRITAL